MFYRQDIFFGKRISPISPATKFVKFTEIDEIVSSKKAPV